MCGPKLYEVIMATYKHRRVDGKDKKVHRLVVERAIGRKLGDKHEVHHVNEDKADYSNTNLVACED